MEKGILIILFVGQQYCDMNNNFWKSLIIGLILLVGTQAFGATYYVDADADAGGDGTTTATTGAQCAWDHLSDITAASFNADDQILLQKGDTWTGENLYFGGDEGSGTSGHPIILGSYGTGARPIIDTNSAAANAMNFEDLNYWTIQGLEFKGGTLNQLIFHADDAAMTDIIMEDCIVNASTSAAGNHAVQITESGFAATNIKISKCSITGTSGTGDGINAFAVTSGLNIYKNYIYSVGGDCIDVAGGDLHIVNANLCKSAGANGIKVHGQQHLLTNVVVRNNIVNHDTGTGYGIVIQDSTDGLIYNNTVYMAAGVGHYAAMQFDEPNTPDSFTGNIIKNNVCYGNPDFSGCWWVDDSVQNTFTASNTFSNNCIYTANAVIIDMDSGTDIGTANWAAVWLPNHPDDINTDPLFTNAAGGDFTLTPQSPARDTGVYLPGYEAKLDPTSSWPDDVRTRDDILSIGAYAVNRGVGIL